MQRKPSSDEKQLDLFSYPRKEPQPIAQPRSATAEPRSLSDGDLLRAIPGSGLADGPPLLTEAGRRGLNAAIPVIEAYCRRFAGLGLDHPVPEQRAAVLALGAIGGRDAGEAVRRLIERRGISGPTLTDAMGVAAALGVRLSAEFILECLDSADADIRADACCCTGPDPVILNRLEDLLTDTEPRVRAAAACALGRTGRVSSRPMLLQLLRECPSPEVLDAVAVVADEECIVLLGRVMRERPALSGAVRQALAEVDHPLAEQLLQTQQTPSTRSSCVQMEPSEGRKML